MKLNLLFVIMYVLTLLVYPIVFMYNKLYQLSISKKASIYRIDWSLFQRRRAND